MKVTEVEKLLLRESLRRFQRHYERMARNFYANLFDIDPSLRPMFGTDIVVQTEKTMLSLAAIVGLLDNADKCRDLIEDLGRRHLNYGVKPEHYPHVGAAMLRTIRQVFGDTLGPEYYAAWQTAFDEMSRIMISAAYPKRQEASENSHPAT